MRRFVTAVFFASLGAVVMACAFGLHFVQSPTGFHVVWKSRPSLKDVYVDTRAWKRDEWKNHPDLVAALKRAGKTDIIPRPKPPSNPVRDFWNKLTTGGNTRTD